MHRLRHDDDSREVGQVPGAFSFGGTGTQFIPPLVLQTVENLKPDQRADLAGHHR